MDLLRNLPAGKSPIDDSFYFMRDRDGGALDDDFVFNCPFAVPDFIGVKDYRGKYKQLYRKCLS